MKKISIVAFSTILFLTHCSQSDDNLDADKGNPTIQLVLNHKVGNQPLVYNTNYTNAFNETYTITKFKYYISNVKMHLQNNSREEKEIESYHLIDGVDATTQSFSFTVNDNIYDAITLYIGVDSTRNVSGAQTGALDPLNGMFWTWNSGYIMAKMEGTSPVSTSPNNALTYHIGGYKVTENALRKLTFNLPNGAIKTNRGGTCQISFNVDINRWFNGVHNLKIADLSFTMSPGASAIKYADNYASMFSLNNVINK
jgi:hypothetical protein